MTCFFSFVKSDALLFFASRWCSLLCRLLTCDQRSPRL